MPSHYSTMFHRWNTFQAFSILFSSCHSGTGWSEFQPSNNAFAEVVWLFLVVFWQSLIWPFCTCLLSWSLLLIVDFDSDTLTSWRVFFTWLDVMKGFFFREDSLIIHHCCLPWTSRPFYVAELTSAFFFFSKSIKLLIWPLLMFLLSIWWICFVFEA